MFNINRIVRDNIRNLEPYSSARDEFYDSDGVFLDANENPFGIYNRYPDPYQRKLKQKLAEIKEINPQNLFLGNGSDEIIDLIFRIFCEPKKDKVLLFSPTYGMYKVAAGLNDVKIIDVPLNEKFQLNLQGAISYLSGENLKLIFICSPNNPTGNSINAEDIELLIKSFKGIVVIDEAYIEFSELKSWASRIEEFPNLVVSQTLSKAYGLAGLRLGMAIANKTIIDLLNKVKPPYNVSTVNQELSLKTLQNTAEFEKRKAIVLQERERIKTTLLNLPMVKAVYHSDANFLLVKVVDADTIYQLLTRKKMIVRNRNKAVENCLRITVGTPEENELLLTELKALSDEKGIIYR